MALLFEWDRPGGKRGHGRGECAGRGRGASRGRGRGRISGRGCAQEQPNCYHSGKMGHVWIDCPTRLEGWRPSETAPQQFPYTADAQAAAPCVAVSGLTLEPSVFMTLVLPTTIAINFPQYATTDGVLGAISTASDATLVRISCDYLRISD
jgi:hypothetical protein